MSPRGWESCSPGASPFASQKFAPQLRSKPTPLQPMFWGAYLFESRPKQSTLSSHFLLIFTMPNPVKSPPQSHGFDTSRSSAAFFALKDESATRTESAERPLPPQPERVGLRPTNLGLRQEWKLGKAVAEPKSRALKADRLDAARGHLQQELARLQKTPLDPQRQDAAHAALTQQRGGSDDHAAPIIHQALQVSVAGSIPTFGVGRCLGVHYGSKLVPPSPPLSLKTLQRAGAQCVFGGIGGGVGNLLGKTLIAPVVDTLPRQFRPVDPAAVLPDRMVAKMNRIRSGWGDEARADIVRQQKEVLHLSSDTNVHCAETAFGVATAARLLAQPSGFKTTLPKSLAISSAVAGLAGAAVGVHMGSNMARAVVRVPRQETLDGIAVSDAHPRHEKMIMHSAGAVPLFYVRETPQTERHSPLQAITDRWHHDNLRDPVPTGQHSGDRKLFADWRAGMHGTALDVRNLGLRVASRSEHMMRATAAPAALGAVQSLVEASLPGSAYAKACGVLLPVMSVRMMVRPWYEAVVDAIPARDAAMRSTR